MDILLVTLAFAVLVLLVAGVPATSLPAGREHRLKLLAVSEEGTTGVTAELFLRVADGTGNVFLETATQTKLDTKLSIKMAKEIACQSIHGAAEKCSRHDFFYRIEANASLLGGPSAGAAAAVLAIAAVEGGETKQTIAVTGTITSGGLIGQVGGLKEKIDAAAATGLAEVLIPVGEGVIAWQNKTAMNLIEYGESLGVKVTEVGDIEQAVFRLTGMDLSGPEHEIILDTGYSKIMEKLAGEICGKSSGLILQTQQLDLERAEQVISGSEAAAISNTTNAGTLAKVMEAALNLTNEGAEELAKNNLYSAASKCFGSNVRYSYLLHMSKNLTTDEVLVQINETSDEIARFGLSLGEAGTVSAMQIHGLVKERLEEAADLLGQSRKSLNVGSYNDGIYHLAYAKERLESALAWRRFIVDYPDTSQRRWATSQQLREGCVTRIQEAEEHMQYLEIYLPGLLQGSQELGPAYARLMEADYASCIYRASIAKAKTNAMLSALSSGENLTKLLDRKLEATKESIARQTANSDFPIVGYSYYEYAGSLSSQDPPSALLFAEYALELSNLDIYVKMPPAAKQSPLRGTVAIAAIAAAAGFLTGVAASALLLKAAFQKRRRLLIGQGKKRKARLNPGAAPPRGRDALGKKR